MCSRARSRRPVDASIHAASSSASARSRGGAASPAASSAARIRCAPLLSPNTTHAQPNPLTSSRARAAGRARCSTPTRRRGWHARLGRRRDARPGRCCAHRRVEDSAASANHAAWAARARARTSRRRSSRRARTRGCCRAVGSERSSPHRRRRRSPASGSRADRRRRSPPPPVRRGLRGRTRPPASGAPPANVARAHRPRWSSGKSSS